MLVVKTRLEDVPGKGIGLIADQYIKKGQPVWKFNPLIDILVRKSSIPPEAVEFFDTYAVDRGVKDFVWINIDDARFINHSGNPNTKNTGPSKDNVAIRDITAGEEITINYTEIDVSDIDFEIK